MPLLVLFTPADDAKTWRVRMFPIPLPDPVPGLSSDGECEGVLLGDLSPLVALDQAMAHRKAGYQKRLHSSGAMELTATTDGAALALCEWVAALIAASKK